LVHIIQIILVLSWY